MSLRNADIAATFEEIAGLLGIEPDNPFRIRAYRSAALTLGEFGRYPLKAGIGVGPTDRATAH